LWGNNRGCHGVFWKGQRQLCQSRAETRPRATAIGATWGGIRAGFRTRSTKVSRDIGAIRGGIRAIIAIFGHQAGTSPRATALGAHWGDTRARCSRASRDRCFRKGIHIWGNNRGCHRAF